MKIADVLNEAPAGTSGLAAFTGAAKEKFSNLKSQATTKLFGTEKQRIAKQNQKKWYDAVKKKQQKNINMTDERTYRKELYNYLSGNGKLPLSVSLRREIFQTPLTNAGILSIMTKTIDARIAAKEKKKQEAEAAAAAAAGAGAGAGGTP
jgi:hypothetical protein